MAMSGEFGHRSVSDTMTRPGNRLQPPAAGAPPEISLPRTREPGAANLADLGHAASLVPNAASGVVAPAPAPAAAVGKPRKKAPKPKQRAMSSAGAARAQVAASVVKAGTGAARRRHSTSGGTPQPADFGPGKPLNTHSPIAVAAAAAVTPAKIRKLLASQGPLAIRHITAHLALTIPGFGGLSLSKQRRLIIATLDAGDPENGIRFSKVGWGRWAVADGEEARPVRNPRESISQQLPDHKPPLSPRLAPISAGGDSAILSSDSESEAESDSGLVSGSESDDDDEDDDEDDTNNASDGTTAAPTVFEDTFDDGTDEEDWRALHHPRSLSTRAPSPREREAIAALVQLRSVHAASK